MKGTTDSRTLPVVDAASADAIQNGDSGQDATAKARRLTALLERYVHDGAVVAFSGGVDSAFLLWAAVRAEARGAGRVIALTTTSASTPDTDRDDAHRFAASIGAEHIWEESQEVDLPEYRRNDGERCYHCKTELFRIARRAAHERGLRWILYGYSASDRGDVRPGHRAAQENGVVAPLAEAELTKEEIRWLMRQEGLELADKPASPCLSSRIMTGVEVTPERLADVAAMEAILRSHGVRVYRVRLGTPTTSDILRVEVGSDEMPAVLECREALVREGRARGYRWVTLDLSGYRTGGGVA